MLLSSSSNAQQVLPSQPSKGSGCWATSLCLVFVTVLLRSNKLVKSVIELCSCGAEH